MNTFAENVVSAILAAAALSIGTVELHREFGSGREVRQPRRYEYVTEWRSILPAAQFIGEASAPITLVEFTDFQCPYCKNFNTTLGTLHARYPNSVATALVHLPLPMHAQSEAAGRAVACAGAAGKLSRAVDFVFAQQDSLGKRPWTWFATGSGIADTASFTACMRDSSSQRLLNAGRSLAARFGFKGTPTVLLNGWRYATPPSDTELIRAVGDLIAGRKSYKDFPTAAIPAVRSGAE